MSSVTLGRRTEPLYALVAQFGSVEEIKEAAARTRQAGYTRMDAYTPFPVDGLDEDLGVPPTNLGWVVLIVAVLAGLAGFWLQWWANTTYYPLNIGGKPLNSWPNWIVIMYELTILAAGLTAGIGMILRNGLPRPYNSIMNTPGFEAASRDKFFLSIEARDPKFDIDKTRAFLEALGPERLSEVER